MEANSVVEQRAVAGMAVVMVRSEGTGEKLGRIDTVFLVPLLGCGEAEVLILDKTNSRCSHRADLSPRPLVSLWASAGLMMSHGPSPCLLASPHLTGISFVFKDFLRKLSQPLLTFKIITIRKSLFVLHPNASHPKISLLLMEMLLLK